MIDRLQRFRRRAGMFGIGQAVVFAVLMAEHMAKLPREVVWLFLLPALVGPFLLTGIARNWLAGRADTVEGMLGASFGLYLLAFIVLRAVEPLPVPIALCVILAQYLWLGLHMSCWFWVLSRPNPAAAPDPDFS